MNKKILVVSLIFIAAISAVLAGAYYFLVYAPAEEKKQIENFYEDIETFESLNTKVDTIESTIHVESEETSGSSFAGFAKSNFSGIGTDFENLASELENTDVPDEIQPVVEELIIDLNAISDEMGQLEDILIYLANVIEIIESFEQESSDYSKSLDSIGSSEDVNVIITEFNKAVDELNGIIDSFQDELESVETPESAEEFQSILISSFEKVQNTTNSVFNDILDILEFSSRVINSPQTLTSADYQRAQNIEAEFDSATARLDEVDSIGTDFESLDTEELFGLNQFDENFEETLTRIANNMNRLESFKAEQL